MTSHFPPAPFGRTTVLHLIDDPALGGVNRCVDALERHLDPGFAQQRLLVAPGLALPPAFGADVIVVHFTIAWRKLGWLWALRLRNPAAQLVLVEHSYSGAFEHLYVTKAARFRAMLRLAYRAVDSVVAVSTGQAAWLTGTVGLPVRKVTVIAPLAELANLRGMALPAGRTGALRLCGYGRYAAQKGFDVLIEAMRAVPAELATLRLVGLGPDEAALRAQAEGMAHVRVEGPVDGPGAWLADVDAVAIPSRFEPFGTVALEARAAGRPIIVSGVDGLVDQAVAPELMVPPENPAALARAIIWLARQKLKPLGQAARDAVANAETTTITAWNQLLSGTCAAKAV